MSLTPQAAFSLTYDGGDPGHREIVIPALSERGLVATFYVPGPELMENLQDWRAIANQSHEIGNGSMLDVGPFYDSLEPWEELEEALDECFPDHPRTSALPWELTEIQVMPDVPGIVRSGREGLNLQRLTDLTALLIIRCDDLSGPELIQIAESGIKQSAWTIFSFAGVGIGDPSVDLAAHNRLLDYLQKQEHPVGPVHEIANLWQPYSIPPLRLS